MSEPKRTWEVAVGFKGSTTIAVEAANREEASDKAHAEVQAGFAVTGGYNYRIDIEVKSCVQLTGPPPDPCPDEAPFDLHLADGRVLTMPGCIVGGTGPWRKIVDRPGWWTDGRCLVQLAQDPPTTHRDPCVPVLTWAKVEGVLPGGVGVEVATTGEEMTRHDCMGNPYTYHRWEGDGIYVPVASHYSHLLMGGAEVMGYATHMPIVARRDGELVAVVMPVRGD